MDVQVEPPAISTLWLDWLRDFGAAASELIQKITVEPANEVDEELQSVRFALYARTLSLFGTARLLAENDKLLDLRIVCRSIIECAIHLAASVSNPNYVAALKGDDKSSRHSRAKKVRLTTLDVESRKLLDEFLKGDFSGAKRLYPSDLADRTDFPRLAHVYREISADAAHVTRPALIRHIGPSKNGVNVLECDPALSAEELHETLTMIALSSLICTFVLIRNTPHFSDRSAFEQFERLSASYKCLEQTFMTLEDTSDRCAKSDKILLQ